MRQVSLSSESSYWAGAPSPGQALHFSPRAGRGRIALAIRVRGSLLKRGRNRFQNARHIAEHLVIPEPQNPVVVLHEPIIAGSIDRVIRVLSSVHLDYETMLATDKIDDIWTNRYLPNELVAVKSARSEAVPQSGLRVGSGSSQASGAPGPDFVSRSHVETPPHPARFARRPLPARGERLAPRIPT